MVFVINLLITYPLMINPANEVVENFMFAKKRVLLHERYWFGNLLTITYIIIAIYKIHKL